MTRALVYKVTRVFFAVAKRDLGCIKRGKAIIGLQGFTRKECYLKVSDWCYNENANRKHIVIKSGFIPYEPTGYVVYAQRDWLPCQSNW